MITKKRNIRRKSKFLSEEGTFENVYEKVLSSDEYETPKEEFQICRYCGESSPLKFKTKAHFIPEFTGNKNLFNFNECDDCNNKFSTYENSLKNFGVLNVFLPIKGKKKFPVHRDNKNKTSTKFTDSKTLITTINSDDAFDLDGDKIKLKVSSTSFIPIYVQKALTKLAISMMPKEDLIYFKTLISWLLDKNAFTDNKIEMIALYTTDTKTKNLKPKAYLFKRLKNYSCPQYSLIFLWGYYKIQIFIPCNPFDLYLERLQKIKLPVSKLIKDVGIDSPKLQNINLNITKKGIISTATNHNFANPESLKILKDKLDLEK